MTIYIKYLDDNSILNVSAIITDYIYDPSGSVNYKLVLDRYITIIENKIIFFNFLKNISTLKSG